MSDTCPIKFIVKRDGRQAPYERERIVTAIFKATNAVGAPDRHLSEELGLRVEESLVRAYTGDLMPSVEDVQDMVETVIVESRHTRLARAYMIYRHQRAMARTARAMDFEIADYVPYKKIYEVLRWNTDHACGSVDELNRLIASGGFPGLVEAANRRYDDEVAEVAGRIHAKAGEVRIAIVAGPSSSGKTTTTIKIRERLAACGLSLKAINVDNYFFDLVQHPKDEFGDYDYETPQALDLERINDHLVRLLDGQTVKTPHYDFKTGRRTLDVHEFTLAPNEILLIDSLHGLYDGMTSRIPAEAKFKIYVETLAQLKAADGGMMRWADNRLLRRMIRDKDHRNLQPMGTLTHWHYVRRSELKNIIPFIEQANCIVNSALPYELPILKARVFPYVREAIGAFADNPKRMDAHIRANRVFSLLSTLQAVEDDSCVPLDALLREFIGGSCYKY